MKPRSGREKGLGYRSLIQAYRSWVSFIRADQKNGLAIPMEAGQLARSLKLVPLR